MEQFTPECDRLVKYQCVQERSHMRRDSMGFFMDWSVRLALWPHVSEDSLEQVRLHLVSHLVSHRFHNDSKISTHLSLNGSCTAWHRCPHENSDIKGTSLGCCLAPEMIPNTQNYAIWAAWIGGVERWHNYVGWGNLVWHLVTGRGRGKSVEKVWHN